MINGRHQLHRPLPNQLPMSQLRSFRQVHESMVLLRSAFQSFCCIPSLSAKLIPFSGGPKKDLGSSIVTADVARELTCPFEVELSLIERQSLFCHARNCPDRAPLTPGSRVSFVFEPDNKSGKATEVQIEEAAAKEDKAVRETGTIKVTPPWPKNALHPMSSSKC